VGINLLREGLDLPEVSLVAILDADKEGFLRSARSLIQTIGRAARNVSGKVIMYAQHTTASMAQAIDETGRRRALQLRYNAEHQITPRTVQRAILDLSNAVLQADYHELPAGSGTDAVAPHEIPALVEQLRQQMLAAAEQLDFERAAALRDRISELTHTELVFGGESSSRQRRSGAQNRAASRRAGQQRSKRGRRR